jgi:creatinine amidohydrolase
MSRASSEYRYEKLTWPEINDAVELGKVCIVPCGSVEQHGPHLPLDVDIVCPQGIAYGAGRAIPDKILVLPPVWYGYTAHVMDFPGTINTHYTTFIDSVLDIAKSLAYHGFKKILLLNGHGSNMPNLDLASRRANLETDAECILSAWWRFLTVDPGFLPRWRQSKFPGGCAHACELETSLYLYLDGDNVRHDKIKSGVISFNEEASPFNWVDLFGAGPATCISWTSRIDRRTSARICTGALQRCRFRGGNGRWDDRVQGNLRASRIVSFIGTMRKRDKHSASAKEPKPCPTAWP